MATRTEAQKAQSRLIAIVLALLAGAALGVAAFGNRWLTSDDNTDGISLLGIETCSSDGDCKSISNLELIEEVEKQIAQVKERNKMLPPRDQMALPKKPWGGWAYLGIITVLSLLVAALGLLTSAILAILRKRADWPMMPTTAGVLGMMIALVNGCIFVATNPVTSTTMAVGWTFIVFGGGIVMGLAAVFPLNRQIRPIDEDLGEAGSTMSWGESRDDSP